MTIWTPILYLFCKRADWSDNFYIRIISLVGSFEQTTLIRGQKKEAKIKMQTTPHWKKCRIVIFIFSLNSKTGAIQDLFCILNICSTFFIVANDTFYYFCDNSYCINFESSSILVSKYSEN